MIRRRLSLFSVLCFSLVFLSAPTISAQSAPPESEKAISPEASPAPKDATAHAGVNGFSVPQCIYCPAPRYSKAARKDQVQGSVVLQVTITAEGQATNMSIKKDPGKGLGEQAIEAVRKWKFKPATGPDGKATAVIVPIEVTFRLYN